MISSYFHGTLPFILEGENYNETAEGVIDTLSFSVLTTPFWKEDLTALNIIKSGRAPDSFGCASMWISDFRVTNRTESTRTVGVNCHGVISNGDKRLREILNPGTNPQRVGIYGVWQGFMLVKDTYFSFSDSIPSGIPADLPIPPEPPPVPSWWTLGVPPSFTGYLVMEYTAPGWRLKSRQVQKLFPGVSKVVDFYEYVPDIFF